MKCKACGAESLVVWRDTGECGDCRKPDSEVARLRTEVARLKQAMVHAAVQLDPGCVVREELRAALGIDD